MLHLINPMWNAFGGSECRTANLYSFLRSRGPVDVWSERPPDPRLSARIPVRRIDATQQPLGGTLVIVGAYFTLGAWLERAHPNRVILIVNTIVRDADRLLRELQVRTGRPVEIVFASRSLREMIGLPGRVEPSPVDVSTFLSLPRRPHAAGPFVVGRLSRDVPEKHHDEDPQLYAALVRHGLVVQVLGGRCLAGRGCPPEVQLFAEGAMTPADFLRELDCFVYRTSTGWYESYGRVVVEAMATGLPVVVHERGGYCEMVRDGETGFTFDTTEDALEKILRVRDEPGVGKRLGEAARSMVASIYSDEYWRDIAAYYLGGG